MFAENRMQTVCEREQRQSAATFVVDLAPPTRRLTPGDWRALHAWLRRTLGRWPQQLRVMTLLYQQRSLDEVTREMHLTWERAQSLRSLALRTLRGALT